MTNAFLKGIGIGIVAGSTIAMMAAPMDKKKMMRSRAGKTVRAIGDVVESVVDALS